ncbi:hypothetical protein [Streptomyces sp. NPDC006335]|uniref:hypothetical protein n=1 Tax=Streptomyces sp. NPDC006335 TaxID=3156895 RepID=UPI0033A036B5
MYLVDIHPEHGVIAAPQGIEDLDVLAVELLHRHGFRWNDEQELFAALADDDSAAEYLVACVAAELLLNGHAVILP